MPGQQQHVEFHRKLDLRRRLLAHALPGAVYVPFCGDADIAAELYADRPILGNDIDPERVAAASARDLADATFEVADADTFADFGAATYAVADFDSYAYPYHAFRRFWESARKADKVVLFFTDGALRRRTPAGWTHPDGQHHPQADGPTARAAHNFYWTGTIQPWITEAVKPWRIAATDFYTRGGNVIYWGVVVESPAPVPAENVGHKRPDAEAAIAALSNESLGYDPMKLVAFSATKKRVLLYQISRGASRTAACRVVGVNLRTLERHMIRYPTFAAAVEWAEMEPDDNVEAALYQAAISGNVPAVTMWLRSRRPERWSDRRVVKLEMDQAAVSQFVDILRRAGLDPEAMNRIRAELARLATETADA